MILVNIIHGFLHGFTTGVREAVLNLEYVKYLNRTVVTQLSCRSYWLCDCTLAHYSLVIFIILSVLQWAVICLSNIQIYSTVITLHTSQIQSIIFLNKDFRWPNSYFFGIISPIISETLLYCVSAKVLKGLPKCLLHLLVLVS